MLAEMIELWGNPHIVQPTPPWHQGTPMRKFRSRKPVYRSRNRAKNKAQRVARRKNRR